MTQLINWKDNQKVKESLGDYAKLLYNKNVLLLGGAKPLPYKVEDYDIIVAANSHSVGYDHRIDIIYTQSSDMPTALLEDPKTKELKYMCINYSQMFAQTLQRFCEKHGVPYRFFLHAIWPEVNPIAPELEPLCVWQKEIGTFVFIGILAIEDMLRHCVKTLTLRGFDFYFTEGEGCKKKIGHHEVEPQVVWLYRKAHFDKRIIIDENLKRVFDFYS